jgi:hypothetical protein
MALNSLLLKCQVSTNTGTAYRRNNWHHPILGWISEKIDEGTEGTFDRIRSQLEFLWSSKMINCLFGQVLSCFDLPSGSKSTKQSKSSGIDESGGLSADLMQRKCFLSVFVLLRCLS